MKKLLLFLSFMASATLQAQNLWTPTAAMPSGSADFLPTMSVAEDNNIWITTVSVSGSDIAHHWHLSTDGGFNWSDGTIPLASAATGVSNIAAVSATTAYVAAYSPTLTETAGIWKTQDAGTTWTQFPGLFQTIGDSFPNFIHFFDANHGICAGDPVLGYFEIYTTSDAGASWTRVPSANIPAPFGNEYGLTGNFEANGNSIWFTTNMARIFKSSDSGATWQTATLPIADIGGIPASDYAFRNGDDGILVSDYHQYFTTNDGGITYTEFFPVSGANLAPRKLPVWYIPESDNSYFSGGTDIDTEEKGSSFSEDGCTTWYDMNAIDQNPIIPTRAWFKNEDFAYCIGTYLPQQGSPAQYQFFRHDTNNLAFRTALGLKKFGNGKFTVSPNPAADIVKISGANVNSVSVCDAIGKVVLTQNFNISTDVSIDISGLQNGVYFAGISSDSGEIETVKIIKK